MRLLLISQAAVAGSREATRETASLSEAALARAAELGRLLPTPRVAYCSPARPALETASALGLRAEVVDELRDRDRATESGAEVVARVCAWLGTQSGAQGTRAAVTHAAVIGAAVAAALDAPRASGRVDIAPCSVTELSFRVGSWHIAHLNWEPALLHIPQRRGRRRSRPPA